LAQPLGPTPRPPRSAREAEAYNAALAAALGAACTAASPEELRVLLGAGPLAAAQPGSWAARHVSAMTLAAAAQAAPARLEAEGLLKAAVEAAVKFSRDDRCETGGSSSAAAPLRAGACLVGSGPAVAGLRTAGAPGCLRPAPPHPTPPHPNPPAGWRSRWLAAGLPPGWQRRTGARCPRCRA
jgi:hypothetical protein